MQQPTSPQEAAELLRELGRTGQDVRVRGGGTKRSWSVDGAGAELSTLGLNRVLEHNEGDFTAVVQAGVKLGDLHERLARSGQMLALDPPLAAAGGPPDATVGGVVASADSGPLRHRYGGVRDLVLGITVVLSDGTVARAGGKVIKNVAGYDLGKLFAGSHGTLGLIADVSLRLHPLPEVTATARGSSDDPAALARVAEQLASRPLEADSLDIAWKQGRGELLVRFAGRSALERARAAAMGIELEDSEVVEDDAPLWTAQRERQRAGAGATIVKVAGCLTDLEAVLRAGEAQNAGVVSRAGIGLSWIELAAGDDLEDRVRTLRSALPRATLTVLDGAAGVSAARPAPPAGAVRVMERLKARFDPARIFAPLAEVA